MSYRIRKTEHNGAKNGGGFWGKRHEAKVRSKKTRRCQSRATNLANEFAREVDTFLNTSNRR